MKSRACLAAGLLLALPRLLFADEGGVSYWLPGQYGSFAASPGTPGWSLPVFYYHANASASGSKSFSRGASLTAGLDSDVDLLFLYPGYVFRDSIFGGQPAIGMGWAVGTIRGSASATVDGPGGSVVLANPEDRMTGGSDLYPEFSLRWSHGAHSTMAYVSGAIPVGAYDPQSLASIGMNHGALDVGGAYTWFDESQGHEASATLGFTYNFENPETKYRNGLDSHLDWAASQFLSEQVHVGVVGYFYQQLTGDRGEGAVLGDFESRVIGLGPQAGYFFELGGKEWYASLKSYWEFAEQNRPAGWNLWMTVAIPIGG
jgi:hypothetical protein